MAQMQTISLSSFTSQTTFFIFKSTESGSTPEEKKDFYLSRW